MEEFDNMIENKTAGKEKKQVPKEDFPIVGIGASAGGLAAFETFFSAIPDGIEPGMAFVLVQHLDPNHKSILTDLIGRYTRMPVYEVKDGMVVQPNCVYVIPHNRDMVLEYGTLQLQEPAEPHGHRLPIDLFFRSLALSKQELAIGIILSGTGSDGTLGVRAIKAEGGMVMAQSPESTEYDGMPHSAIATDLVDYVLPPAEMPGQLIAYVTQAFGKRPKVVPKTEDSMRKIFNLLRILPYRTLENVVNGAVVTIFDITEMKRAKEILKESEAIRRLAVIVHDASDAITLQDMEGRILAWNPMA